LGLETQASGIEFIDDVSESITQHDTPRTVPCNTEGARASNLIERDTVEKSTREAEEKKDT
jgi:hypothetical protein